MSKNRNKQQEVSMSQRVRVVDVAPWCEVKVEVTNIERLEKALERSLESQRALTMQTQTLLAEMQKRGVLKQLGRAVWKFCQRVKARLEGEDG